MRPEIRKLLSRQMRGFEMLPNVHQVGDLFTLDMDSVAVIEWHAPVEWLKGEPPPDGTPRVRDKDGGVWTLVKQENIPWVQVIAPVGLMLPLGLFE